MRGRKRQLTLTDPEKANIFWHDLKRDAVIIKHFSENLREGVYGRVGKQADGPLATIAHIAIRSLLYIENLMLTTKYEQGVWKIKKESCNITEIATAAASFLEPVADDRHVRVTVHGDEHIETRCDRRYTTLMLENVMAIALEFATRGTVLVDIGARAGAPVVTVTAGHTALKQKLSVDPKELADFICRDTAGLLQSVVPAIVTTDRIVRAHGWTWECSIGRAIECHIRMS